MLARYHLALQHYHESQTILLLFLKIVLCTIGSKTMAKKTTTRPYLLYVAVAAALIPTLVIIFLNSSNNNNSLLFFLPGENKQQQQSSEQREEEEDDDYYLRGAVNSSSGEGKQVQEKYVKHLCGESSEKNTEFIQEYSIPVIICSQPVGIAVDNNDKVWIAATWVGYLVVFDPDLNRFVDFIGIPNWKTKGIFGSMVWGMEFDKKGDLWFTDQVNNAIWRYFTAEKKFEMYKVPTKGSYPGQVAFDSQGRVWFSEIFGKKLGVIDPDKAVNNTTTGITEYELELEDMETMGPVTVSSSSSSVGNGSINYNNNKNIDSVWFTAVDFPKAGQIVRFDINKEKFQIFDLPTGSGVPIGIAEDDKGRLWINNHATNLFFMLDPLTEKIVQYSTSLPTSRNDTTTLPYWNTFRDGRVWFNEHEGNAMAYFDIANSTLVEYMIPTRGKIWGNTSNPLKFVLDNEGSAWFTEWTENKIGVLDSKKLNDLPIWLSVSKDKIILDRSKRGGDKEESLQIFVYPNNSRSNLEEPVKMTVAGSISPTGRLWNMTGKFSEDSFYFPKKGGGSILLPHIVTLTLQPMRDLVPGIYTLTVGARYDSMTYSKIVSLVVK
jgi:virginiamycin B lyase